MAKVKIEGLDKVQRALNRNLKIQVNKLFRDEELRKKVGVIVVKDIKENVDMAEASDKTKKWREVYGKLNKTDPAYNKDRIKAVFTGELLEDLKTNVKGFPTERTFEIGHSNKKHKKYQGVTKKIGSRSTYSEISDGLVKKLGYNYFQLTDEAQKEIADLIKEALFKLIRTMS